MPSSPVSISATCAAATCRWPFSCATTISSPWPTARPPKGSGLYQGAAAASMLNWRERVLAGLRQGGVLTIDAFPEDLTAQLVNRYLEIKARHLL